MAPVLSLGEPPARPTKRHCTGLSYTATTSTVAGHAQAPGAATPVELMSPVAETALLRLAKASPKWWMPCIEAAVWYATEFADIVKAEVSVQHGGIPVFVLTKPRSVSSCVRIVHCERLLMVALPPVRALKPRSWVSQLETVSVPLSMMWRIAFKGDAPFEVHQLPRDLRSFRVVAGRRAHLRMPKWTALFSAVCWLDLQHLDLDFERAEMLEPMILYLPAITCVMVLMFMRKGHDELKAQMLSAIPRGKIEYLMLQLHVSPTAAMGLLDRLFSKLQMMRTIHHSSR
ncbi:hypothetical protein AMAG_19945 [Allomyces macrogynus ATCC 38327]|uniref:Uncharacterized protein n=1 Tax=Allomyces macrogynus (strain ATCC 38327) TaxID=578462 RepID=A0A0L0T387_ALLM3|nr:hypothetical protein AMAG_19945 [Allomyces macrogynus ATCC 38327]|eukprot:KNE69029.1 hypothetical protein AMAG_19945 [Allomyces macrogynus ATCC 38327]